MTDPSPIDPSPIDETTVVAYRQRRAPPGFAARVTARAGAKERPAPLFRWSAAAVGLAAGSALVFVIVSQPPAPPAEDVGVPAAPDYWAEISVPVAPPVSGLTDFGAVPQLPPRPDFEDESGDQDQRSRAPRRVDSQLSLSTQQENTHEAV